MKTVSATNSQPAGGLSLHQMIETTSVVVFPVLFGIFLYYAISLLYAADLTWSIAVLFLIGWLAGDWLTGMVHWFCDTYGSEDTPLLGESIIQPFREHHVLPQKICTHSFIYTNGNSFLLGVVLVVPFLIALMLCEPGDTILPIAATLLVFTGIFSCLANQVHKWAHTPQDELSGMVRWLQKHHLVLNPEHHELHHTKPFDTNYCISCGWMNPVLEWTRFFRGMEKLLSFFGLEPAHDEPATRGMPADVIPTSRSN
ncbi:MAG: fatty acid desaturase family protein [bacterium]|nr:fatty acid desaturase family protein [bacterium]